MKILFIHVPAALMAINAWLMMLVASLVWFIRRHHVSALAARAAAPVGATMTLIALADRRDLGRADVGDLVGLGPAAHLVLRALSLLSRLHGALGGGGRAGQGGGSHRHRLPRRLGLRAPVALCGLLLEPGAAPGAVACRSTRARTWTTPSGGRSSSRWRASWLLFVSLVLVRTRTEIRARRLRALEALEARG